MFKIKLLLYKDLILNSSEMAKSDQLLRYLRLIFDPVENTMIMCRSGGASPVIFKIERMDKDD